MNNIGLILDKIKEDNPKAVFLFGSAAKGKLKEDSDYDILVVKDTKQSFSDRIRDLRLKIGTNIPIDLIVLTPKEAKTFPERNSFYSQIFKEGKLIYGGI